MTSAEVVRTLPDDVMLGFNLTMAREELRGAFVTGHASMEECHMMVGDFAHHLHAFYFGKTATQPLGTLMEAAEALSTQVRCVTEQGTADTEDISLHLKGYMAEEPGVPLEQAFQYTLFDMLQSHWDMRADVAHT